MTKKILLSAGMIVFVAAGALGMTGAFFSDVETSTGNTFTAGALDLKVDNTCHYFHLTGYATTGAPIWTDVGCDDGQEGTVHNWTETDLIPGVHKFFSFNDIKPGDRGENTISLHVYNNDAWGGFRVKRVADSDKDNTCTEPEGEAEGTSTPTCDPDGELDDQMVGNLCLDQGAIAGFQNMNAQGQPVDADSQVDGVQAPDPTEGDNICQQGEPELQRPEGQNGFFDAYYDLSSVLASAYTQFCPSAPINGANNYNACQGLAQDGRMVGSTTYYFAWEWMLPASVGNNAQTDSIMGDVEFNIVQHRNNPNKDGLLPVI